MFKLFKWIFGIIMSIVIGVGATILIVNAKYGINMIDVYKSLGRLCQDVAVEEIAPNAPKPEDKQATMTDLNASLAGLITYNAEEDKYSVNTSISGELSQNIKLTGQEACVLINWFLDGQEDGLVANIGGSDVDLREYEFKLVSIEFSQNEDNTVNYNVIMSISLVKIKEKMNYFPLSLLRGKVPDTLYINSTVKVEKKEGAFNYEVSSVGLGLNLMTGEEVDRLFKLVNIVANVGDVADFNMSLGKSFVDALIGNADVSGLAYSLRDVGATDFNFVLEDEVLYYVIEK